jgi:flagellar motility protein MotE (MotC chaperone)
MLASTDVLMKEKSEKTIAQIILSFGDDEIANATTAISNEQAASMLSMLPPDRMMRIVRKLPIERARGIVTVLGAVVHSGVSIAGHKKTHNL